MRKHEIDYHKGIGKNRKNFPSCTLNLMTLKLIPTINQKKKRTKDY